MKGIKTVYRVESVANQSPEHTTERLNDLAAEGWELIGVADDRLYLERMEDE